MIFEFKISVTFVEGFDKEMVWRMVNYSTVSCKISVK